MVIVVAADELQAIESFLNDKGETYSRLGEITADDKGLILCHQ